MRRRLAFLVVLATVLAAPSGAYAHGDDNGTHHLTIEATPYLRYWPGHLWDDYEVRMQLRLEGSPEARQYSYFATLFDPNGKSVLTDSNGATGAVPEGSALPNVLPNILFGRSLGRVSRAGLYRLNVVATASNQAGFVTEEVNVNIRVPKEPDVHRFSAEEKHFFTETARRMEIEAAATKAILAACLVAVEPAATKTCAAIAAVMALHFEGQRRRYEALARDPVDPAFASAVRVRVPRTPTVPAGGPVSAAEAAKLTALGRAMATSGAYATALETAVNRAQGARASRARGSERRQMLDAAAFAEGLARALDAETRARRAAAGPLGVLPSVAVQDVYRLQNAIPGVGDPTLEDIAKTYGAAPGDVADSGARLRSTNACDVAEATGALAADRTAAARGALARAMRRWAKRVRRAPRKAPRAGRAKVPPPEERECEDYRPQGQPPPPEEPPPPPPPEEQPPPER